MKVRRIIAILGLVALSGCSLKFSAELLNPINRGPDEKVERTQPKPTPIPAATATPTPGGAK